MLELSIDIIIVVYDALFFATLLDGWYLGFFKRVGRGNPDSLSKPFKMFRQIDFLFVHAMAMTCCNHMK